MRVLCFLFPGHPNMHMSMPTQLFWFRVLATTLYPRDSAAFLMIASPFPMDWGLWGATLIASSTLRKNGSMPSGVTSESPCSHTHLLKRFSEGRRHIPPLITVDPPTHRPSLKAIPGVPRMKDTPAF